jgi:tRNA pseudouridine55 synthase
VTPSGLLNLAKPAGPTSHDCVARVRCVFGCRRVGHAGTLDPQATGVLLVGVGQGARILEYLQGLTKTYRAAARFGIETDTQDIWGTVRRRKDPSALTEAEVEGAVTALTEERLQTPPMVSAVKLGGRKLYELARQGEEVEREPRPIAIHRAELLAFRPGPEAEAEFRIVCSSGVYVRTLCHDLGRRLGPGAAMSALIREAVGPYALEQAVALDALTPDTPLQPLAEALVHLPGLEVDAEQALRLCQGQFVGVTPDSPDGPLRVMDGSGRLVAVAVARGHGETRLLMPEKVFGNAHAGVPGS